MKTTKRILQKNQKFLIRYIDKAFRQAEKKWQRKLLQELYQSGATMLPEVKGEYSIAMPQQKVHSIAGKLASKGYRINGVNPVVVSREFRLP